MSDDPRPPGGMDIANYYVSINTWQHPAIIEAFAKHKEQLSKTPYFCGSVCNCDLPPCNDIPIGSCPDSGCASWWTPWWDLPECESGGGRQDDPIAKVVSKVIGAIDKELRDATDGDAMYRLTEDMALFYSNQQASAILYDSMFDSVVSILSGMIYTFLEAGVYAGYIAGASKIYGSLMKKFSAEARYFKQSFKPFEPPPIGL